MKGQQTAKPDMMHAIEDFYIPSLVNVKIPMLELCIGRNKIDDVEFMTDDFCSCEADRRSIL